MSFLKLAWGLLSLTAVETHETATLWKVHSRIEYKSSSQFLPDLTECVALTEIRAENCRLFFNRFLECYCAPQATMGWSWEKLGAGRGREGFYLRVSLTGSLRALP